MKRARFSEEQIIGILEVSEARKLKDLERENSELKRMVAEQALDIRMLKDRRTLPTPLSPLV